MRALLKVSAILFPTLFLSTAAAVAPSARGIRVTEPAALRILVFRPPRLDDCGQLYQLGSRGRRRPAARGAAVRPGPSLGLSAGERDRRGLVLRAGLRRGAEWPSAGLRALPVSPDFAGSCAGQSAPSQGSPAWQAA